MSKRLTSCVSAVALALVLMFLPTHSRAQGVTSLGTDFWVAFPPNYLGPADNIRLYFGSGTQNKVQIDVFGGSQTPTEHYSYDLAPDAIQRLITKSTASWEGRTQEKAEYKAIHVYSTNPIVLYGMSNESLTTDSYLAIPTAALGTEYYPSCYYDDNYGQGLYSGPLAGEFIVVAPYDNTDVTIGPAKCDTRSDASGTVSHHKGDTWTVSLMRGQTYLVQSTGTRQGEDDLTGTLVASTKPVGVISGHQRCSISIDGQDVNGNSKDYILEMMPPIPTWGTEYYEIPMAERTGCGDEVRLIAAEDGTYITENGNGVAQLNKGDFVDRELILQPTVYKSNGKKFMVMEHAYIQGYNGDQGVGDPYSICMTPKSQFQKKILFEALSNLSGQPTYTNYATFLCQDDSIGKILLNGKGLGAYTSKGRGLIPNTSPQMAFWRVQLAALDKTYLATCGAKFGLYVYGFSPHESYGNPAGSALGISSPDTLAPLEKRDSLCGNFTAKLFEPRHKPAFSFEDTRISDFAMITDPNDQRWPIPSFNYRFQIDPNHPFVVGDSEAYYSLTLIDPTQDAYAAVWTTDRAGNDTVYEYHYNAPKLSISAKSLNFDPVRVSLDSCTILTLKNVQASGDLILQGADLLGLTKNGNKFTISPSKVNQTLHPGDSMQINICYLPVDTTIQNDTLIVSTKCVSLPIALRGRGVTPIIEASDIDFGAVEVGAEKCQDLKVRNVGNADLVIDKNSVLADPKYFGFSNSNVLPVTIKPGGEYVFTFCFHPDSTNLYSSNEGWGTNLLAPFLHANKDTSFLKGYGIKPGLNWDRPNQSFQVECEAYDTERVYLINPSTGSTGAPITITKVDLEGPDAADYQMVANSTGYTPLESTSPWQLAADQKIWIDVQFHALKPTDYHTRHAQLVAYGTSNGNNYKPVMDLTGTIRHSTLRIAPTSYDFGAAAPGTSLTTTITIFNDGDTNLVLSNLTLTPPFTMTGVNAGDVIKPGGSAVVTVTVTLPDGPVTGTLSATPATVCDTVRGIPLSGTGTDLAVAAIGHDYQKVYECQSSTSQVTTSNTSPVVGGKWAYLDKVEILDPSGQYTFDDGSVIKTPGVDVAPQQTQTFNVTYKPNMKGASSNVFIEYTWRDTSKTPAKITVLRKPLDGIGLHYSNLLSVEKKYGDQVYSATTGDVVSIPVQMTTDYDNDANVYGIEYTFRYRRDEFTYQDVVTNAGLTPDKAKYTPVVDPTDSKYEIVKMHFMSTTPILPQDTIAHIDLRYVISVDTLSPFELNDVTPLDKTGAQTCWVTQQAAPGTFYGKNLCGDQTIREHMRGSDPAFSIKHVTPNPVTHTGTIDYDVRLAGAPMTIEIYNLLGNKSMTIMQDQPHTTGSYQASFDASQLPSGVYTIRVSAGGKVVSQNIVVNK